MLRRIAAAALTVAVLVLGAVPAAAEPECQVRDLSGRGDVWAVAQAIVTRSGA